MLYSNSFCRYKEGADGLEVDDWDTGETRSISLDPSKSPNEQAQAYFKKAAKMRRTSGHVLPLIAQAEVENLSVASCITHSVHLCSCFHHMMFHSLKAESMCTSLGLPNIACLSTTPHLGKGDFQYGV